MRLGSVVYFRRDLDCSGGAARLGLEWLEHLRRRGVRACVVTYRHDPAAVFDGRYRCPVVARGRRGTFAGRVAWLGRRLAELAPDVVLVEGDGDHAVDVYLATRLVRRPYVALVHGSVFAFPPEREWTKHGLVFRRAYPRVRASLPAYEAMLPAAPPPMSPGWRLLVEGYAAAKYLAVRGAAGALVLSERNRREVRLLYGRDAKLLRGAYPAAILDHVPSPRTRRRLGVEGREVVLTVSRLARLKRVDLTLRAFARVAARRPPATLLVGGDGPERPALERLASELGLGGRARFLGPVPEAELWDTLAACDAFIHMDLADFDIAPLEALALGRKVVWSDEMDPGEALEGDCAVFPAAPDEDSAARALERALDAPAPPPGAARRARLAAYTWERYFESATAELEALA